VPSKRTTTTAARLAAVCLAWLCARPVAVGSQDRPAGPAERVHFSLAAAPPGLEPSQAPADGSRSLVLPGLREMGQPSAPAEPDILQKIKPGRAWIELGSFIAVSGGSYWIRYKSHFVEDWQFKMTLDSQVNRILFLEGWRFDSNNYQLNWTHSLAGGIYYQFGRTSHMSWLYSWMMSIVGSTFWEAIVEWKEVISLNDQITTGLGGFAIGEPWYQVGHYLAHQSGILFQALSFMNPAVKINHWLDRKDPGARDYVQPGWHDFGLAAGARSLSTAGQPAETAAYFAVHTQLIGLPEYGKAGDIRETVKDTYFSSLSFDYAARNGTADETNFSADASPWGYFRQKIDDNLEGYSLTVGLGSSFEYFKKRPIDDYDKYPVPVNLGYDLHLERPRNFTDKLAIVHIAGPVLDWTVFRRGWKIRTVAAAYFDFGLINSYALNGYSQLHHTPPSDTIDGMKTTVLYYGYYYGFGGTLSGNTRLEWGGFRARAQASFGAWSSVDVLDRFQIKVTNNAHLVDNRFRYLFGAGWKLPRVPFELFVNYEGVQRWGRLLEVRTRGLEKRLFAGIEFSF
jgi:hypothetical protein